MKRIIKEYYKVVLSIIAIILVAIIIGYFTMGQQALVVSMVVLMFVGALAVTVLVAAFIVNVIEKITNNVGGKNYEN